MAATVKCAHCEALNLTTSPCCVQCGAPLGRAQTYLPLVANAIDTDLVPVGGIDASAWNGTMDWTITQTLAYYAFLRGGYGDTGKDIKIDTYRSQIVLTPMVFGLYWYVKVGLNWRTHVSTFKTIWQAGKGVLPPVMDLEFTTLGAAETTDWIYSLLEEWKHQTGVVPMIYTSPGWWNEHTIYQAWMAQYELWDAHWTTAPQPILPRGFSKWWHWQHSADGNRLGKKYGSLDGDADMDLDIFNGYLTDFNAKYHVNLQPLTPPVEPPLPPIEPLVPKRYVVVTANGLNMRSVPGVIDPSTDIGTLHYGDDIPVLEERNGWIRTEGWVSGDSRYVRPK